jgi:tetratricopeptide (TPR) repeat protein
MPDTSAARARAEELRGKALALLEKGVFGEALAAYDDALREARATADLAFVDWMFACRAAAAAETGACDEDLLELKKILLRTTDQQTAFRAAYTGARIYELRRDFRKASFYARLARQHAEALGDAHLLAAARNQLGSLLTADSRFEEAAAAYREALDLTPETEPVSPIHRAHWKGNLGYCLIAMDHVDEGLAMVHEVLDFFEREGARSYTVVCLLDLCFGYLKANRYTEARYFGEEGLARRTAASDSASEKNFLYLLGEACHLGGDTEAAQGYFDRLAAHYPEFRNLRAYLEVFDFRNVINLRS